jgi:hypothetical protein
LPHEQPAKKKALRCRSALKVLAIPRAVLEPESLYSTFHGSLIIWRTFVVSKSGSIFSGNAA